MSKSAARRALLHKYLVYGFIENLDTVRHIALGPVWGVNVSITPLLWLNPIVFLGLYALQHLNGSVAAALVFLLAVDATTVIHAFGHILGGKLVSSPMDELLFTATRGVNLYRGDQSRLPGYVHLGRALGGPIFNLLIALCLYRVAELLQTGSPHEMVLALASMNLLFGVGALLPLPSVDGQVIWREVRRAVAGRVQTSKR